MNPNERQPGEKFKAYRKRLRKEQAAEKVRRRGRLLWSASDRGTYVREKHGKLK